MLQLIFFNFKNNNMQKIFLLVAIALAGFLQVSAQEGNEKIEAMKIAFITKRLQLTPEESQKFWPVYNQYEAEKKQIRQSTIGTVKDLKEDGDFTNAEAEQAIAKYVEFKAKDLDLIKKYVVEFRKILPATKVAKLVTAEDHFKKMLAKQAQQGGPKQGQGGKPWKPQGQ
jgi:Spy/CpxP family protein refolding chaperone